MQINIEQPLYKHVELIAAKTVDGLQKEPGSGINIDYILILINPCWVICIEEQTCLTLLMK